MRDLMIFGVMLFLVPLSIRNSYVAYLLWGWAGLASISSYLYGFMLSFQLVQFFALIALVSIMVKKDTERRPFEPNRTATLLIVFSFQILLSATFAYDGHPRNWEYATNMLKTVLFCLLMPLLVTSRFRIHVLVLVIAISTGHHGLIDGLKFISSGGGHMARGIAKFGDNNHYAMVLIMVLPLLLYCYRFTRNKYVKLGFLAVIPLEIFAVIATQSRGGLACLSAVGLWFVLTSRRKVAGIIGVAVCVFLVVQMAPDSWTTRMNTIGEAGEDSSFLGRVGAWRVSSAIALANPILGGGFHVVELGTIWERFKDSPHLLFFLSNTGMEGLAGRGRAAHSIYFETLGDLGFLGFFMFMVIFVNALITSREISRMAKSVGESMEWARSLAEMLTISLIAFMTGGALLSAAYFELPYILCMLLEVLRIQVKAEVSKVKWTQK